MQSRVRMRLTGMTAAQWVSAFQAEIASAGLSDTVEVLAPQSDTGVLEAGDAGSLTVLIPAAAQVLAAAVTALATVYAATRAQSKGDARRQIYSVLVIIDGSKDTAKLSLKEYTALSAEQQSSLLARVGQIREVSLSDQPAESGPHG